MYLADIFKSMILAHVSTIVFKSNVIRMSWVEIVAILETNNNRSPSNVVHMMRAEAKKNIVVSCSIEQDGE